MALLLLRKINKQSNLEEIPNDTSLTPLKVVSSELKSNDNDISLWGFESSCKEAGLNDAAMSVLLCSDKIEGKFLFEVFTIEQLQSQGLEIAMEPAPLEALTNNRAAHYNIKNIKLMSIPSILTIMKTAKIEYSWSNNYGLIIWRPQTTKNILSDYLKQKRINKDTITNEKMLQFLGKAKKF